MDNLIVIKFRTNRWLPDEKIVRAISLSAQEKAILAFSWAVLSEPKTGLLQIINIIITKKRYSHQFI